MTCYVEMLGHNFLFEPDQNYVFFFLFFGQKNLFFLNIVFLTKYSVLFLVGVNAKRRRNCTLGCPKKNIVQHSE